MWERAKENAAFMAGTGLQLYVFIEFMIVGQFGLEVTFAFQAVIYIILDITVEGNSVPAFLIRLG